MQTDFNIVYVPLPPERNADWRYFIQLVSDLIRKEIDAQMNAIIENQCLYRFVWYNPSVRDTQYGTFLFNDPGEARVTETALKAAFPEYELWLEDRDGNRVAIPR